MNETEDPQHQIFLRSALDLPHGISFDPAVRWIGALKDNDVGPAAVDVPSYVELNVRLAWRVNRTLEISVSGENLLHAHHAEYNPDSAGREEIPRLVYAKAAFSF